MSISDYDNEFENSTLKKTWYLVKWVNTNFENNYDIVNETHVISDVDIDKLQIGDFIIVQCSDSKASAYVQNISENTDLLHTELQTLEKQMKKSAAGYMNIKTETPKLKTPESRKNSIGNKVLNIVESRLFKDSKSANIKVKIDTSKAKKRNRDSESYDDKKYINKDMHMLEERDIALKNLLSENQRLKAQLYESNKLLHSLCKDLQNITNGTQKKIREMQSPEPEEENFYEKLKKTCTLQKTVKHIPIIETDNQILIGSGKTPIPKNVYYQINWSSYTSATRKLLSAIFPREILATHSLTGKPSPAFMGISMPIKTKLDSTIVADIVETVSAKCEVPKKVVRSAITTKCADENKMLKKRMEKDKENIATN